MLVKEMDETHIREIGHAFGYYNYGKETSGMNVCFRSPDAVAEYICGYVRCVLAGGFLHTTSPRGEAYIAYKLPGQKIPFRSTLPLIQGIFRSMSLREIYHFAKAIKSGGPSLEDLMAKKKEPCVFVGMVCVREAYQGQGYMRKVLDIAFAEGTGSASRSFWTPMRSPSATSICTLGCSSPGPAALANPECCTI